MAAHFYIYDALKLITTSILLRSCNVGVTLTLLGVKNYKNVLTQILRHFNDRYSALGLPKVSLVVMTPPANA